MKEIWINLELYIKSYDFSIFRDFFWIFLIYFTIFYVKNDLKKMQKWFIISRGTHVDATWHIGPRGSATRDHAAPTRRRGDTFACYLYVLVLLV